MFDVAFSELVVIALVALIVIGPEKLPRVARTFGLLAGRLQRYLTGMKAEVEHELKMHELRSLEAEVRQGASAVESGVTRTVEELGKESIPPAAP